MAGFGLLDSLHSSLWSDTATGLGFKSMVYIITQVAPPGRWTELFIYTETRNLAMSRILRIVIGILKGNIMVGREQDDISAGGQ